MNTTARIARLRAEAEELEAQAWDKRAEASRLEGRANPFTDDYARFCRARSESYRQDAEKAEAGTIHASTDQAKERV